ncbi:MAG: hypothetical protein NZ898_03605 [Myxococcota bacterium]|nr:hypothetical protein [Myxococcota bacterium]MDW8361194.1 hypothetical protein [Myxococcales bacterium]
MTASIDRRGRAGYEARAMAILDPSQVPVNVPVTEQEERAIRQADQRWTGPRLVALTLVTLGISIAILYAMASTSAIVPFDAFLLP